MYRHLASAYTVKITDTEDAGKNCQFTECHACKQTMLMENLAVSTTAKLDYLPRKTKTLAFFCSGNVFNPC